MFSLRQEELLLTLRGADAFWLIPPMSDRKAWASVERALLDQWSARADLAARETVPPLLASMYARRSSDDAYRRAATRRRSGLAALALGACARGDGRYDAQMTDLIYAICEESAWSLADAGDYPDPAARRLDPFACETGALLTLTDSVCELGARAPHLDALIRDALASRVLAPLVTPGDHLLIANGDFPEACASLLLCALLGERDERRRWLCLRRTLRLLEQALQRWEAGDTGCPDLPKRLRAVMAVCDCFTMIHAASGGEVELRDAPLFAAMANDFVSAHIAGRAFLNPGGDTAYPDLSPDALFRLGENARLRALCGLAACLRRDARAENESRAEAPLFARLLEAFYRADLTSAPARSPRIDADVVPDFALCCARAGSLYAALSDSRDGTHADAGDITIFDGDTPILLEAPGCADARCHSVPTVRGFEQDAQLAGACDVSCETRGALRIASMNLAGAYPSGAGVSSWQRTLLVDGDDPSVRVMDVFDVERAQGDILYRFVTPHAPRLTQDGALLGAAHLRWDADLTARVREIQTTDPAFPDRRAYVIELLSPCRASGGNASFVIRHAG